MQGGKTVGDFVHHRAKVQLLDETDDRVRAFFKDVGDFLAQRFYFAAVCQPGNGVGQFQHFFAQRLKDGGGQFQFDRIPRAFQFGKGSGNVVAHFLCLIDREAGGFVELVVQFINGLNPLSDQRAEGWPRRFAERADGRLSLRSAVPARLPSKPASASLPM